MAKRIAIAIAVLLIVVAALQWLERSKDRSERAERSESRLVTFDERAVGVFEIETPEGSGRFEKDGTAWVLVRPHRDAADPARIGELFKALHEAPVARRIEEPESLDSYGLDPPVAAIRIETGERVTRVDFGEKVPPGEGVFARLPAEGGVAVVEDRLYPILSHLRPETFRDPTLLDVSGQEARAVTVRTDSSTIALERREDGWWIVEPSALPASKAAVERLVDALDGATVGAFLDGANPDDPLFGLGATSTAITVAAPDRERRVMLGAVSDLVRFALRSGREAVLAIDPAAVAGLPLSIEDLAEKRLTGVNRYRVVRFSWTSGDGTLEADKRDETWVASDGSVLSAEATYAFLAAALETETTGWTEGTPSGREIARLEVDVEGGGATTVTYLEGGRATVDRVPGVVYRVPGRPPNPPGR